MSFDWFLESQKATQRGWNKEKMRQLLKHSRGVKPRFLEIKPIVISSDALWSVDLLWSNPDIVGKLLPSEGVSTKSLNSNTKDIQNRQVHPVVIKFDIDKGKVIEDYNASLARVAYGIGVDRIPVAIINCIEGKPIDPLTNIEFRYAYYWKFIPYDFDSPEPLFSRRQRMKWKEQSYLINNRQLFSDVEWQELRKSFLGTWKHQPAQNVKKLREYLQDMSDPLRMRRVHCYLNGEGFRKGIISHPLINQLKFELDEKLTLKYKY